MNNPAFGMGVMLAVKAFALLCCIVLLSAGNSSAQQPLSDTLNNVSVIRQQLPSHDTKLAHFSPGQKIVTLDSAVLAAYQQQSVATLLSQQAPVFIKSYGYNSLSTLAFRGSSAAQSLVLWQGVPIQNASSGIADISLLPVLLIDKIHIVYGSSAALWGSGNTGGAMLLENKEPTFGAPHASIAASLGGGSFQQYQAGLKAELNNRRWYTSIRLFGQDAKNDFSFKNDSGKREQTQNAHLRSGSLLAQVGFKVNTKNTVSGYAWLQQYNREIPQTLFEDYSVKKQDDGASRGLVQWQHTGAINWYLKTAWMHDYLQYTDSEIHLSSSGNAQHIYSEAGLEKTWDSSRQRLLVFAPAQWLEFHSDSAHHQLRAALAGAYDMQLLHRKLNAALNARLETIDSNVIFLPGVNASYIAASWLTVRANIQRTYRAPTLTELYYFPGGNRNLKPEEGWNFDGGYTVRLPVSAHALLIHNISVYTRYIHNWISWFGGTIWTPHNISAVRSSGVETEYQLVIHTGDWQFRLSANASYTAAITKESIITNDHSIGDEIPYTPRWNGQGNAGATWHNISLSYNHAYTGVRYYNVDETGALSGFQTGNLLGAWNYDAGKYRVQANLAIQNIWNARYEVVAGRPMPGINYLAGVTVLR